MIFNFSKNYILKVRLDFLYKKSIVSLLFIILFLNGQKTFSQNFIPGTLYSFDKYKTNSGYAGLNGNKVLSLSVREQWIALEGRPRNYTLAYSSPFYKYHGAAGVKLSSFNSGIQKYFNLGISYNYVIQTKSSLFSFGLGTGMKRLSLNKDNIVTPSGNYSIGEINHNDQLISNNLPNRRNFLNFSAFGVFIANNFEIGIVFDKELALSAETSYSFKNGLKLNWQYIYGLNDNVSIKAFGLIYSDFVLVQNDFGAVGIFRSNYIGGLNLRGYSFKTFDSISMIVGGNVNINLRLLYSYDFSISNLQKVEDGSHEIKIIYNFGKKNIKRLLPSIIYNPRL